MSGENRNFIFIRIVLSSLHEYELLVNFVLIHFCVSFLDSDVICKDDIKKKFRDTIFVEDECGNLVKYIRCKSEGKPKRSTSKKSTIKPVANSSVKSNAKSNKKQNKKSNIKPIAKPVATPLPPMKPFETMASEMKMCLVTLNRLSDVDIAKMKMDIRMDEAQRNLKSVDMNHHIVCELQSGFVAIQLPEANGKRDILIILESIYALPKKLFVLDENWSFELQKDGNLIIESFDNYGNRCSFSIIEPVWRSWIDFKMIICNENVQIPLLMDSTVQHGETNMSIDSILSLMDIDTSYITQMLGGLDLDLEMLVDQSTLSFMDWYDENDNGYDADDDMEVE